MKKNSGFPQKENAGRGLLISLEERVTMCVLFPTAANRRVHRLSEFSLLYTQTQVNHANTCLMWKLTTYSALVRWTEMAKGSKGWKVKATRRRTA